PEQIAGNVQDVDVSASVIRLWSRQGLINIRKQKYHRQNGTPKERAVAQTKRDKEREIARLREQLKNDGELVRHSIFD
ncbi:IS30 family transposase, partial [Leuconostoc sp. S51]|nr:IS30 family transposase [Leuconostoc sp. S51]MBK0052619.1 IS30 family transposase [Leuconostoc sp. S50]